MNLKPGSLSLFMSESESTVKAQRRFCPEDLSGFNLVQNFLTVISLGGVEIDEKKKFNL